MRKLNDTTKTTIPVIGMVAFQVVLSHSESSMIELA